MAAPNVLSKSFTLFKGLDLRTSDLLRDRGAATGMKNVTFRQTGALSKRPGYQFATDDNGSYGLTTYNNADTTTGAITQEVITIDDDLHKLSTYQFTITYSGSNVATYDMYLNSSDSKFYFDVYDGTSRVLNQDLGTGLEGSPYTVASLVTAINALTDFSTTAATGGGTRPAAFIPTKRNQNIATGTAVTFQIWDQIDTPGTYSTPFSTFYAQRTDDDFENASFTQIVNNLYISTGHDSLHKYDSNRVYLAGLPQGTAPTDGAGSGGSLTYSSGEAYNWKYTYVYKDAKGNQIESQATDTVSYTTTGASESREITVTNLTAGSGYNTDQAVVNGNQSSATTITVDSGHGIKVGDNVWLTDQSDNSVVNKTITATTATSITFSGAVDVNDNDVISNVKIVLYRTKADGSLYFLSKELINDTDNATQSFDDGAADTALGAEFLEPIKVPGLPPKGKYIDTWRGQLIISGSLTDVDTVYYSDIISPELFPPADNSFIIDGKVTGLRALDNLLFVFEERAITGVAGDLGTDNFQVDRVSRSGIGCVAHASIQEVEGKLFFLSNRGVFAISAAGLEDVGFQISPKFQAGHSFSFKRAVGFNWVDSDQYVLFMPNEPVDASYSNDTLNEIYVYDYFRDSWLEWSNFNTMGGITATSSDLYFSRRTSTNTNTAKVLNNRDKYDYADHTDAIAFTYKTHWETLGEPSLFKKFLRLKVHSYDTSVDDFEGDVFTLNVITENDYFVKTLTNITMDFSGGAAGWGSGVWNDFPWGEQRLSQLLSKLASKKAKSMRTIFSNSTLHQNILLSGYELEVSVPFKTFIKE